MDKYLARIDYSCPEIKTGGIWVVLAGDKPYAGKICKDILPSPGCKTYLYKQSCEDTDCNQHEVIEVRDFSEQEAIKLGAARFDLAEKCSA